MSFPYLHRNLAAISSAMQNQYDLVSDPHCTVLVETDDVRGHAWNFAFTLGKHIFQWRECKKNALSITLQNIKGQFANCLARIEEVHAKYFAKLSVSLTLGSTFKAEEEQVQSISRRCKFLTSRPMLYCPKIALAPVQRFYKMKTGDVFADEGALRSLERFSKCYAVATVSSLLQMHYPNQSFMALCHRAPSFSSEEERSLQEWIQGIEKNKYRLNVWLVHLALWAVAETFFDKLPEDVKEECGTVVEALGLLEWRLYQKGCVFFYQDDPLHMDWVKSLEPGATVEVAEGTFTKVGKRCDYALLARHSAAIMELPDRPADFLFVARNPVAMGMWLAVCKICARDVQPVAVRYTDPALRYCIIEKVHMPLSEMQWQSKSEKLAASDVPYAEVLVDFLSWLNQGKEILESYSLDEIFFKVQGNEVKLRALMPLSNPTKQDFLVLEDFARKASKGNPHVFFYLMNESGLMQHAVVSLFRDVAYQALTDRLGSLTIQDFINTFHISDSKLIDTAIHYVAELQTVVKQLIEALKPKLVSEVFLAYLKDEVAQALLEYQSSTGYTTTLCPCLKESVTQRQIAKDIRSKNSRLFVT